MSEKPIVGQFRAVANTVTDPGVLFGVGNTVLEWQAGGSVGLIFNIVATAICIGLRAAAENKNAPQGSVMVPAGTEGLNATVDKYLGRAVHSPRTSLVFAGIAQFGVAAAALCLGGLTAGFAIPALFAAGNITAALKGEPLDNVRKGIANFIIGKTVGTWAEKITGSRMAKKIGQVAWKAITTPELYYTMGLMLAGGWVVSGAIFAATGIWAIGRVIRETNPKNALLRYAPLLTLSLGNFMASWHNAALNPHAAVATGLFGFGYAAVAALQEYGGVFEFGRAVLTGRKPKPPAAELR